MAFGLDGKIGIDVENERTLSDMPGIAMRYFSAREYAWFAQHAEAERQKAFFTIWTRKEALVKAIGKGIGAPLDRFSVPLDKPLPALLTECDTTVFGHEQWTIYVLQAPSGYQASLALDSGRSMIISQTEVNRQWLTNM